MKKYLFIFMFLGFTTLSFSQDSVYRGWEGFIGTSAGGGDLNLTKGHYSTVFISAAPGYRFNKHWALRLVGEAQIGMMNSDFYRSQGTLGLNAGYRIKPTVELNVSVGSTLWNEHKWNFVYYDLNARWFLSSRLPQLFIGIGARYQQMYNNHYRDQLPIYASFGVELFRGDK